MLLVGRIFLVRLFSHRSSSSEKRRKKEKQIFFKRCVGGSSVCFGFDCWSSSRRGSGLCPITVRMALAP
jgi:hypothetical protein